MITRREVAKVAGVSEGTVSNVMNGKECVKPKMREHVLNIIKTLNYIPNQTARSLVKSRSSHIGIAIYETTNPYHMELSKKIEETAVKRGYIVSLFMLDNNLDDKLKVISERRLDGLINFMTNDYPEDFVSMLERFGTILVNFTTRPDFLFLNDYRAAMKELMEYLYKLGHRKIAYLSSFDEAGFIADGRGQQFIESASELKFDKVRVFYNKEFDDSSDVTGIKLSKKLLQSFPEATAVFCTNDLAALGCMRTLAEAGKFVPNDISVIGCDDINLSRLIYPSLSTISINKTEQGEDIANSIIDKIENDIGFEKKFYHAKAIIRESIAPPKR